MKYRCKIHDHKPDVCAKFPRTARNISNRTYGQCGYYFDSDGKRCGECSRCGVCCSNVTLDFEDGTVAFNEKCQFLVEDTDGD